MKKLFACGLAALSLLGAGCVFSRNDYVENAEFDLELPKQAENAPAVRVGVFKNLSGSDRRIMVRRGDGQVVPLEYQRWRMSPELLLQRCTYGAFQISEDNASPRLNATIYRFEFDERDNKAHLAVDFTLVHHSDAVQLVRVDVAVPVKDSDDLGAARAAAMSECARIAVGKLSAAMSAKTVRKVDKK